MNAKQHIETTLFIIRHGETEFNRKQIVQGRGVDAALNPTGIQQAKTLAQRLSEFNIDVIYASTLLRAKQTANLLIPARKCTPITLLRDLEEMSWGVYEGQARSHKLSNAFDEMKREWRAGNYGYRIEQGETLLEVQKRGVRAIEYIVEKNAGKNILMVSHGRFIRILLATILDEYELGTMSDIRQYNTAFNHIVFTNKRYKAKTLNCIRHLREA